ncbi:hypothetical protein T4E_1927 [Trichinella pseudospiralis]|uniref:Uncharacterized protein n=1 Tax=Trichinella pseudospiralis TaxID=6337 RepID=A0A0V0XME2_TRIPS|nr:hypothetical protein T4E_1927 [Trichinella pseudospiralis]
MHGPPPGWALSFGASARDDTATKTARKFSQSKLYWTVHFPLPTGDPRSGDSVQKSIFVQLACQHWPAFRKQGQNPPNLASASDRRFSGCTTTAPTDHLVLLHFHLHLLQLFLLLRLLLLLFLFLATTAWLLDNRLTTPLAPIPKRPSFYWTDAHHTAGLCLRFLFFFATAILATCLSTTNCSIVASRLASYGGGSGRVNCFYLLLFDVTAMTNGAVTCDGI